MNCNAIMKIHLLGPSTLYFHFYARGHSHEFLDSCLLKLFWNLGPSFGRSWTSIWFVAFLQSPRQWWKLCAVFLRVSVCFVCPKDQENHLMWTLLDTNLPQSTCRFCSFFLQVMKEQNPHIQQTRLQSPAHSVEPIGRWWHAATTSEEGVSPSEPGACPEGTGQMLKQPHKPTLMTTNVPANTWGTALASALANWLTKARASSDQRPPTSAVNTTNRARPWVPDLGTCAACVGFGEAARLCEHTAGEVYRVPELTKPTWHGWPIGLRQTRKPVRNDLQRGVMVGNGRSKSLTNPSSGFTTDPCRCTLREPPTPQDSHSPTVVAKDVKWTATPAGRREREGKPEGMKKQDMEEHLRSWSRSGLPLFSAVDMWIGSSIVFLQVEFNSWGYGADEEVCGCAKTFPDIPDVSLIFGGSSVCRCDMKAGFNNPSNRGCLGNNPGGLVTCEFPLQVDSASTKSLESFMHFTSFCSSWSLPDNSIIIWSSMYFFWANSSKVEFWNFCNSFCFIRSCWWTSRKSCCCRNNSSWRILRSCSAWAARSSWWRTFSLFSAIIVLRCASNIVLICALELSRSSAILSWTDPPVWLIILLGWVTKGNWLWALFKFRMSQENWSSLLLTSTGCPVVSTTTARNSASSLSSTSGTLGKEAVSSRAFWK